MAQRQKQEQGGEPAMFRRAEPKISHDLPKSPWQRPSASLPVEEVRRNNLRAIYEKEFDSSRDSLAKALRVTPGRISQLLVAGSTERFTEDTAAKFEVLLNKRPGSLSSDFDESAKPTLKVEDAAKLASLIGAIAADEGQPPDPDVVRVVTTIVADEIQSTGRFDKIAIKRHFENISQALGRVAKERGVQTQGSFASPTKLKKHA